MTQNAATPHARLVVSRELLLKAAHHHDGMYKHGGGYYLLNGRWHKLRKDKPVPKGAPVAAHPKSGGDHAAVAHFTQEQWSALKLPDTNTNAPSYNKALANLQKLSDAGDVTGMLAISYGSNTYGQKLAKIANHLLGLHGSKHQVVPGQKAGTHAALQAVPAEPHPTGLPEHLAPKTTADLQEPGPLAPLAQHVKDTLDEKAAEGNVEFIKLVAANNPEHPQIVAHANKLLERLGANEEQGAPAAGTYDHGGIKKPIPSKNDESGTLSNAATGWLHAYQWGVDSPAGDVKNPIPSDDVIKELGAFVGKSPVKLYRAVYLDANDAGKLVESWTRHEEHASVLVQSNAEMGKKMKIISQVFQPADIIVDTTKLPKKFHNANDSGTQAEVIIALGSLKERMAKLRAATPAPTGPLTMPAFEDGKAPALEPTGNASAGTISAVDESKVPDLLAAATGPMSSKAYILAALRDKSKHKFVSMNGDAVVAAISFGVSSGTPEFPGKHVSVKNLGSSKPGQGSKLLNIAIEMAAKMGVPVALKAGSPGAAAFYKKHGFVDGANINMMVLPVANMKVSAPPLAPPLAMPDFQEGKTTAGVKAYYEKVAQKIIDHGHAGNASVLEGMKEDGLKPNAKGKTTNTWLGKTANSKKLLALHAAALAHAAGGAAPAADDGPNEGDTKPGADGQSLVFKNGRWHKYVAADESGEVPAVLVPVADAPAPAAAPAITPETGNLSAQQLGNLQSIPWHKLKLPAENTNAKSHNAALAKIEAMAFAGDTAGLQAFIAAKGGAKQTYAKKQVLTAQTALAGLGTPGATAAVPVQPAPEPANPHILTEDQEMGLLKWMAAGKPTSNQPGSWSKLWGTLPAGLKAELKSIHEATASKAAATTIDPEQKQVLDELAAGEHWVDLEDLAEMHGPGTQVHDYAQKLLARKPTPEQMDAAAAPAAPTPKAPAKVKVAGKVYENTLNGHNKFWAVSTHGSVMKTTYGKIGTKGQETVKHFPSEAAAQTAAAKLTAEKKAKGYNMAGFVEHEHDAPGGPTPAAQPQGPKEGDTKQGADGMLVLKDGHWVKMGQASPASPAYSALKPAHAIQIGTGFSASSGNKKKLKAWAVAGDAAAIQTFASELSNKYPSSKKYAQALLAAMSGGAAPGAPASSAAAAPAPAAPTATPGAHPPMDAWAQVGPQGGSNPGGKFRDPSGQEWYCKFPADEATARSEILAAKLYGLAGLSGQDAILVSKGGKVGIATKWVDIKKAPSAAALAKVDGVQSGFAVDAWLGNWDVVGLALDNLQIGPDGKAHRVDAGGSLEYRAQGEKKPFGAKVDEIDTLRDAAKNPHAAAVFGKMTKADIVASVAKVAAISDVTIRAMVNQYGPGTQEQKAKLAETLIARKADLLKRYPQAAKKKKAVVFDPSKVSAPPSFLNWGGSGKSGPSSKEFLNKANEEAAQSIYQAAKTGNIDAIKSLQANVYDKDTGAVVGSKPVLEHPSQHIKGYAQQVINEINYQMNPPKRFRFDGGHPLHSLNAAYPAHNGAGSSAAAQKLGKYIVLGTPGTVKLEDLALPPKITHSSQGGSLNQQTYSPAAQAAIAKMPATQQQAVQSYTGPSHQAMNISLWAGNPTGAAKSAGEALKTLGHDIAPGTVLSRKINLHGADLEAMLASSGKILQEPAIMSTSIRPSSWSGNVQLKLHVGPGVKGLWVGPGSKPGGGALSKHASEDEMILPPGTRMLIMSVKKGPDSDGFGQHGSHIIEAVILPT